ncbi:N-acetyltransferase [Pontibacter actiniarum]|uniref:N-acetyltransferase n=2 Tax=Pontibacter actiniarum TaxID=323450 RepID=A0A1X9YY37_9BACT|nr:N-acetyltransferase [Pontibacter actiniarum]
MALFPLSTARLNLRLVCMGDLEAVHALHALPETDAFNTLGIPEEVGVTEAVLAAWLLDHRQANVKNYTFAVELAADGAFVGLIALKLGPEKYRRGEVWYKLHPDYWGRGLGTEALNRVLDFGFGELHLHRIEAGCAVDNIASVKVLEKVGMTREGRRRQVLPLTSGWSDNFEYAILETDPRR